MANVGLRSVAILLLAAAIGIGCSSPAGTVCDGADCEPCELATWYADLDGDGLGAAGLSLISCSGPDGYVPDATDCDDSSTAILGAVIWYADADGDGDGAAGASTPSCDAPPGHVANAVDCDDADRAIHPSAPERCNAADDDCDGTVDEGAPTTSWYADLDQDDHGDPSTVVMSCAMPIGYVIDDLDCNDGDAATHPGATEACGAIDRNCDGAVQNCCGDGFADLAAGEQCDPPQDGGCLGMCNACACPAPGPWRFTDVTAQAGLDAVHAYTQPPLTSQLHHLTALMTGGVAASDLDNDGDVDLYTVGGQLGRSVLWINQGNGTFADRTVAAQITPTTVHDTGPLFADVSGDGADDLLIGGVVGTPFRVFINQLDGTFADGTTATGLGMLAGEVNTASMADVDHDGDLDLALGRWGSTAFGQNQCTGPPPTNIEHLWRNDGGVLTPVSASAGLASLQHPGLCQDTTFVPNFDYFDGDGLIDLAFTADFGESRLYLGAGNGVFTDITTSAIDDEFGMGASTGDVDGDGDIDWFVTSIRSGTGTGTSGTGNRLYLNDGSGNMTDRSGPAGVRDGGWGWAACLADFDNDGNLDIFHVNGFNEVPEQRVDPARLFLSNGDGSFTERSFELGVRDFDQGRGVSCFDYDGNGSLDIAISNNQGPLKLWRNNGTRIGHYLVVSLSAPAPNARGIGARIELTAAGVTQRRTIKAGSNYASQDPALGHFGLGTATTATSILVRWPDGTTSTHGPFAADQRIVIAKP